MPETGQSEDIPEREIDLGQEFTPESANTKAPVQLGEGDRLSFARQILFWLVVITIASFSAHIAWPDNKGAQEVFELVKIGVLPLVTLVIGFYFPNSKK